MTGHVHSSEVTRDSVSAHVLDVPVTEIQIFGHKTRDRQVSISHMTHCVRVCIYVCVYTCIQTYIYV